MKLNKKGKMGLLAGALAVGMLGGAFSYYSGTAKTQVNTFHIVAGATDQTEAGTIKEPNWNEDDAKNLQPGQTVKKDPLMTSNVDYEAWAFMKVEIPTLLARLEGDTEDQVYDALTLNGIDGTKWQLIKEEKSKTAGQDSAYIYGYKEKLASHASTEALFHSFTIQDFIKAEELTDSIDVSGSLIQTVGYETLELAADALGVK